MTTPGALLFDFGGTLDVPGSHWLDRFLAHYRAAGMRLTREQLDPAFAYGTTMGYREGAAMHNRGLGELIRFLVDLQLDYLSSHGPDEVRSQLAGLPSTGRAHLLERIGSGFIDQSSRGLAESREVLSILASRFRLGVISNFYGNLDRILADAGMRNLFATVIDSARLGVFKPERGIFEAALEALAIQPAQAAMIGDSLDKDCIPARSLGMKTVWMRPVPGGSVDDAGNSSLVDHTIGTLGELVELQW